MHLSAFFRTLTSKLSQPAWSWLYLCFLLPFESEYRHGISKSQALKASLTSQSFLPLIFPTRSAAFHSNISIPFEGRSLQVTFYSLPLIAL